MAKAACLVLLHPNQPLFAVCSRRGSTIDGFPGGKQDPGETLAQAAARETAEEIGVHVDASKLELLFADAIPGKKDFWVETFIAVSPTTELKQMEDDNGEVDQLDSVQQKQRVQAIQRRRVQRVARVVRVPAVGQALHDGHVPSENDFPRARVSRLLSHAGTFKPCPESLLQPREGLLHFGRWHGPKGKDNALKRSTIQR